VVSCFNFNIVVTDSNQVGDCVLLHVLVSFEESFYFPLLVIVWVEFFKFCSCTNYYNVLLQLCISPWQKPFRTHLDPSLSSICDYIGHLRGKLFRLAKN
jgi:hypothetical protein